MKCKPAGSIIDPCIAKYRELLFVSVKKPVLDQILSPRMENCQIDYDLNTFLGLLNNFADNPQNYNGIRAYFASYVAVSSSGITIPAGKEQYLTLIYVPTKWTATGTIDDFTQCFSIDGNSIQQLPENVARTWINNFQLCRVPALEQNGKAFTNNPKFRETRSLWYSMATMKGSGSDVGLINYIYCLRDTPDDPTNPLDKIVVNFSAFAPTDGANFPFFQLSLIFDLHQKNDSKITQLNFGSTSQWVTEGDKWVLKDQHLDGNSGDTGVPCPPDTGCIGG